MNKFQKDTRVMKDFSKYTEYGDGIQRGVTVTDPIVDPLSGKEKVYVKLDVTPWREANPQEVLTSQLLLEADGDAKFNKLEAEYTDLSKQIREKMEAAGQLLQEADLLAQKAGRDSLQDMYDSTGPLLAAMDNVGWNTSSFSC